MHTEWNQALEEALAEPFPKELHMQKGGKGTFVSVHHYVARLNELVGVDGWSMPTPVAYHSGNKLGLMVGVTILGVTKWNVGDEMEDHGEPEDDGKVRDFGSSSTNSFAQAFKRCCAYGFGLGLYLYDKEGTRAYLNGGGNGGRPNHGANTHKASEPATEKQIALLQSLMKSSRFTEDEKNHMAQKIAAGMTKAGASKAIERANERLEKAPA